MPEPHCDGDGDVEPSELFDESMRSGRWSSALHSRLRPVPFAENGEERELEHDSPPVKSILQLYRSLNTVTVELV